MILSIRHLLRLLFALALFSSLPLAFATTQVVPGDTPRDGDPNWVHHHLGDNKHCLSDNPNGKSDSLKPGKAAVVYRDAPAISDQLFLYMEGGSSCHNFDTCTGVTDPKSVPKQVAGYTMDVFNYRNPDPTAPQQNKLDQFLYLRMQALNAVETRITPFQGMNLAMIPYCTGDSHTGRVLRNEVPTANAPPGAQKYFYFYGHFNFVAAFNFLAGKYPNVKTIWLMGTSAGAGGAAAEYNYIYKNFVVGHPDRRIHLIEDSVPVVPPIEPEHWDDMVAWQSLLPGFSNCTQPPASRPQPPGANGVFNAGPARNVTAAGTAAAANPSPRTAHKSRRGQAGNGVNAADETDPGDQPTGIAYPFPDEADGGEAFAGKAGKRRNGVSANDTPVTLTTPYPGTCYLLQDTRLFNRSKDALARFSIVSFVWDSVLNPYGNNNTGYAQYFNEISLDAAAIENQNPQQTRHLYVDNTFSPLQFNPGIADGQGGLCGRHVVTNFNGQKVAPDGYNYQLQDFHYSFIFSMILPDAAWTSSTQKLSICPANLPDFTGNSWF